MKLLEENTLEQLTRQWFFGQDPRSTGNKKRKNWQLGLHLTKKLLHSKENNQQSKIDKIFASYSPNKGLISKMFKKLK
jgi:hypothetical protein